MNDNIREQYEKENGPDLHPARSEDVGMTIWDALWILGAVLAALLMFVKG